MDKKDVIKITLELIKEKKLEKTSIGEIVKKLDSSPGNLYYHFKSKNEIYKETADYSYTEIIKSLNNVKSENNRQSYLFRLTKTLIKFFEEREDILYFLMSIRGSYFFDKESGQQNFLAKFQKILSEEKPNTEQEKQISLKLNMFLGSVYEVLYVNKLVNNRNLNEEEIKEMCMSFWGNIEMENYKTCEQNSLKVGLS